MKTLRRSLFLLLALLFFAPGAWAQSPDFITDVVVLGHSNSIQLQTLELTQYSTQGWTVINHNLNAGCTSGDFIHLLYKKQSSLGSSSTPITDFYILAGNSSNAPNQLTHEGRTYTIVPYDGSTNFINSKGDLNRGAGGAYIHLYYTKDPMPNYHSVSGITFNSTQSGGVGANGNNTTGYDLNSGAGGDYIYMHVATQLNANVVMLSSSSGEILLHDGEILTGTGGGDTHVKIADGATVTLGGASITSITNDLNHMWAGLSCLGDAVIVLDEGTTNAIMGGLDHPGIHVPQNHTLTLQGNGTLNATGGAWAAGIGSSYYASHCGNITINGGIVTATGGEWAAGIGSGYDHSSCGDITINGGTVTANGGPICPGIGSGYDHSSCGDITITNGVTQVTAITGSYCDYAIGAGYDNGSTCGIITIGSVETGNITQSPFVTFPYTVSFNANGGSGTMSDQSFMYNVAQNLNANTFTNGLHPIFGWATSANGPKVYDDGQSVSNLADTIATVNLYAKWRMHHVMLTSLTGEILLQDGDTLTGTGGGDTHVSIADGATVTLSGANITNITSDNSHKWAGLTCLGDAVIVLAEGTTNNLKGGRICSGLHIPQGHTLTLQGSGTLNVTGDDCASGIGSNAVSGSTACGNITINGGTVTAHGGGYGAGIGSGYNYTCGNITISGGTVNAHGNTNSAGIGCGAGTATCGTITISGGTVNAYGGYCAAAIGGGGSSSSCGNITITNGVTRVTATKGNSCHNAIGAGNNSSTCGTITIGGKVTGNISQSPFVTFPYTVAFNANGGGGTMANQDFMYNIAQYLHANSFTHGSLSFIGWATSAEGPKVYDNCQNVNNLADTIATVNLYAKWGSHSHTATLAEGWNWWSTYIEQSDINGLEMLQNSLGAACVRIQGRNGYLDRLAFGDFVYWDGNLTALTNEEFYMIRTNAACSAVITGAEAQPASHPITLNPGWNWIGFPSTQSLSLTTALSGITIEPDDQIKGRNQYATYLGNFGGIDYWDGTLTTFNPGQGYMYKSNATTAKTLVYQTGRHSELVPNITTEGNIYQPASANYADNMTVTAVIELDGEELRSDAYELAAFVGDECRGSVKLKYVEPIDRYVAFLLVYGDVEEEMSFVLTDGDEALWSNENIVYTANAIVGKGTEPYVLRFGSTSVADKLSTSLRVYPNPVAYGERFSISAEEAGAVRVEIANALGAVISAESVTTLPATFVAPDVPGVYTVKILVDSKSAVCRKLVVR